jgi:hypothetical protein
MEGRGGGEAQGVANPPPQKKKVLKWRYYVCDVWYTYVHIYIHMNCILPYVPLIPVEKKWLTENLSSCVYPKVGIKSAPWWRALGVNKLKFLEEGMCKLSVITPGYNTTSPLGANIVPSGPCTC